MEKNPYESSVLQGGNDTLNADKETMNRENRELLIRGLKAKLEEVRASAKEAQEAREIADVLEEEARRMRKLAESAQ